jgi:adenine-specific DNA-methyltransferase
MVDLDHPYLKKQLIAYIGNKRSLLPLLHRVFEGISGESGAAGGRSGRTAPVFLDPFAGSGSVSRLARYMGYRVLANDWEYYAYVLNFAHLCVGSGEAAGLFGDHGGSEGVLEALNTLPEPQETQCYISRYYAPANTRTADYRRERLFYTRENALIIDAIRNRIEELHPGLAMAKRSGGGLARGSAGGPAGIPADLSGPAAKEKLLLLASLLYQCATHTNTSGVFKACHKGFGGHGRDALGRILKPIRLQMPILIDGPAGAEAGCEDALQFVGSRPADICYLDPPYNQHQYGSNYHLLNTIARWDKPEVDNELRADGRLRQKAGIRRDWIRTRSAYCYRRSAGTAFRQLLEAVDARHIVLSYNTEGIIPFEELVELMNSQGRVELFGNEYIKYRGGKQSIARQVHNLEFVLVLDRRRSTSTADRERLERAVLANRLAIVMKRSFCPGKIRQRFDVDSKGISFLPIRLGGHTHLLPMPHLYRFSPEAVAMIVAVEGMGGAMELETLLDKLKACECADRQEEIRVLLSILQDSNGEELKADRQTLQKRILWLLRKFAHRKYKDRFDQALGELRSVAEGDPDRFAVLLLGLEEIAHLARIRFEG